MHSTLNSNVSCHKSVFIILFSLVIEMGGRDAFLYHLPPSMQLFSISVPEPLILKELMGRESHSVNLNGHSTLSSRTLMYTMEVKSSIWNLLRADCSHLVAHNAQLSVMTVTCELCWMVYACFCVSRRTKWGT